jgi:hypothetical protein
MAEDPGASHGARRVGSQVCGAARLDHAGRETHQRVADHTPRVGRGLPGTRSTTPIQRPYWKNWPGGKRSATLSSAAFRTQVGVLDQKQLGLLRTRSAPDSAFKAGSYFLSSAEMGWDEFQAEKFRAWQHQLALTVLTSWFVAQTKLQWMQRFAAALSPSGGRVGGEAPGRAKAGSKRKLDRLLALLPLESCSNLR